MWLEAKSASFGVTVSFIGPTRRFGRCLPDCRGNVVTIRSDCQHHSFEAVVSHIVELIAIDDSTKRSFYEVESIRGNWSVRELKRQVGSLYFERFGLSLNKNKLADLAQQGVETQTTLHIRAPYIFEFLGLKFAKVMSESHLEEQITEKLQAFLLELGHGFCFEARQKRILIGDEHFFIDLVFYHRILKCHVLVELKLEKFSHENLGQLNTYVNWYRRHMMTEDSNPPVGILLCTDKNHALAEYALAGMGNHLFVSKYLLELPDKQAMQRFIDEQMPNRWCRVQCRVTLR
ncbi:PDDEXK nuclease domain-containing protein [Methylotuvimicrobium alcaliphilum]|uniref:PDDEXK nuclease domain-containing protein n=1 Tax=Methylotuvimicrobium alcaliphilum TaxID=271065 RepID=UPI0018E1B14B|nr:PDDEXK nuclease domain-containing protein [Methylotuvimicrobium alcaliphilum]